MDWTNNLALGIIVTHVVIIAVNYAAKRFTILPEKPGGIGIYFVLLPMGFRVFGSDLPPSMVAPIVSAGLAIILWSLRRQKVENGSEGS